MMYGFTVQNKKARVLEIAINLTHLGKKATLKEDSFAYDEQRKIACVADGVTRDFKDGSVLTRNLDGILRFLNGEYPSPSPAREAADICTKIFLETKSWEEANQKIWYYNLKNITETDYLGRDLAGCTAAGFWEDNGEINWSFICDSGIAIIEKNGRLKFKTLDEGPHSERKNLYLESRVRENGGWNNPQARVIIRRDFRNNPNNNYFSFGVLTGEKNAERYIGAGKQPVMSGDYVLAFTDGMGDIAFNKNPRVISKWERAPKSIGGILVPAEPLIIPLVNEGFFNYLNQDNPTALKKFCQEKIHSEGTLIVYKVE